MSNARRIIKALLCSIFVSLFPLASVNADDQGTIATATSSDVSVHLSISSTSFREGDDPKVVAVVQELKRTAQLKISGLIQHDFLFTLTDDKGAPHPIDDDSVFPDPSGFRSHVLQSGKSITYECPLSKSGYRLKPGKYTLLLKFLGFYVDEAVASNPVSFEVLRANQ